MTNEPETRDLFNPFVLWTDLGMRAAEAALASTQTMTEGADRLTRAVAGAEAAEAKEPASAGGDYANAWTTGGMDGIASMQRLMWDMTARNWVRWMSAVGNFMSAGAGVGLARKAAGQDNPLATVRDNMEHALASAEPKPRRKPAARRRPSHKR
ncbi:MAG: hypothetical protein Q8Q73_11925 [Stagnimonas sp.]|nr:hypothetical protein [Stagnimonas sp.]